MPKKELSDIDKTYNVVVGEINRRTEQIEDLLQERNQLAAGANAICGTNIWTVPMELTWKGK